ncbi:translesion DNA synthesis-associated protein ImuA [Lysobacter humi (ex Lee et al. 2017)]
MATVVRLDEVLASREVWRGRAMPASAPEPACPTGLDELDAALPSGGWPQALTELLVPADGVGELHLLWPALARLSEGDGRIVLVAPPYLPYAPAWQAAGVHLPMLQVIEASLKDALWAAEQCMRSGTCAAVLCWPRTTDDRLLRRLQVAAETGGTHAFAIRPVAAARNPSPAALRVVIEPGALRQLRVIKCRGALAPPRPIAFPWR